MDSAAKIVFESERIHGNKINFLCGAEIGGSNTLAPIALAMHLNLHMIDCDFLGLAFPKLQMSSINIAKMPIGSTIFAD